MLTLLFFEPDDPEVGARRTPECAEACAEAGIALTGSGDYRHAHWRDQATGAWAEVDVGWPEMDEGVTASEKSYTGWRRLPLQVEIPLTVPHWYAVEAATMVDRLLQALPGAVVLDTEDPGPEEGEAGAGPGPLDRLRLLASWELQHLQQTAGLDDLPRASRAASVAAWRYRRERANGQRGIADCEWPELLVLAEGQNALTAIIWADPTEPLALPPVQLVVVTRPGASACMPVDELITAVGTPGELPFGGAVRIDPNDRLQHLHANARLLPRDRFRAVGDHWTD
jgi:hypothetical protein